MAYTRLGTGTFLRATEDCLSTSLRFHFQLGQALHTAESTGCAHMSYQSQVRCKYYGNDLFSFFTKWKNILPRISYELWTYQCVVQYDRWTWRLDSILGDLFQISRITSCWMQSQNLNHQHRPGSKHHEVVSPCRTTKRKIVCPLKIAPCRYIPGIWWYLTSSIVRLQEFGQEIPILRVIIDWKRADLLRINDYEPIFVWQILQYNFARFLHPHGWSAV